ncbi:MAG: FAD-dependent oxidoreductase [Firmicutes bacterium]|nr:FAD-dependent oxidoreductase [Bacillota bacterium]
MTSLTIIGGGVAGLSLALALTQRGVSCTVFEARPEPAWDGGAALAMAPNAMAVLQRLGVAEAVTASGSSIEWYRFMSAQGQQLALVDLRPLSRPWGASTWCIPRQQLLSALGRRLPPGVLTLGSPLGDIRPRGAGFVLYDEAGDPMWEAEAVTGADGARSVVRERLWGATPLTYQGFFALRAVTPFPLEDPALTHTVTQIWGQASEFGFSPMGPSRAYWYATFRWPNLSHPLPPLDEILARFASWCDPVPALIARTPRSEILVHPIFDRLTPWPSHPLPATLVGDAAHLMTPNAGQGACQALLDSWVLARVWAASSSPLDAFRTYRAIRLAHALEVARTSRRLGQIIHRYVPVLGTLAPRLLRAAPDALVLAAMARIIASPARLGVDDLAP